MNILDIGVGSPNEYGARMGIIRVDGRDFLHMVREIERPIATAAGEPSLAGKYDYLNIFSLIPPSEHLLGKPAHSLLAYANGQVSLLECECGCEGCWPFLATIEVSETTVVWHQFRQPHRDDWVYPEGLRFVFDRRQYDQALRGAAEQAAQRDAEDCAR